MSDPIAVEVRIEQQRDVVGMIAVGLALMGMEGTAPATASMIESAARAAHAGRADILDAVDEVLFNQCAVVIKMAESLTHLRTMWLAELGAIDRRLQGLADELAALAATKH